MIIRKKKGEKKYKRTYLILVSVERCGKRHCTPYWRLAAGLVHSSPGSPGIYFKQTQDLIPSLSAQGLQDANPFLLSATVQMNLGFLQMPSLKGLILLV